MALGLPLPARLAVAVPTLYALMSVNEYCTHRYFQHAEFNREPFLQRLYCLVTRKEVAPKIRGGGHVEHHAETYDDMSLKNDKNWNLTPASKSLEDDLFRGTAFSWQVSALMFVQMLPTSIPVFALLGFSLPQTLFGLIAPGIAVHAMVWNALHPPMHGLPPVPMRYGMPSAILSWMLNTPFFKYIYENHQGHHVLGGQVNYNVCCPMTDHLVGSYVPPSVWTQRMRPLPKGAITRGSPVEPLGVPQVPGEHEPTRQPVDIKLGMGSGVQLASAYD